jgi:hypothetical protein
MASAAELLVVGHQHAASMQLLELLGAKQADAGSALHTWHVDNKYYRASIACRATSTSTPAQQCQGCEAVVLVFDPRSQEAFQQLQAWWGGVEEQAAEIQLVVALFEDAAEYLSAQPRQQWLQAAEEWCGEQMVEYVELCSSSPAAARGAQDASEGKQGLARLVEALQSHMWPSAEMHQQQSGGAPAPAAAAAAAAAAATQGSAAPEADTKEQPDQQGGLGLELDGDSALDAFERLMSDMTGGRRGWPRGVCCAARGGAGRGAQGALWRVALLLGVRGAELGPAGRPCERRPGVATCSASRAAADQALPAPWPRLLHPQAPGPGWWACRTTSGGLLQRSWRCAWRRSCAAPTTTRRRRASATTAACWRSCRPSRRAGLGPSVRTMPQLGLARGV